MDFSSVRKVIVHDACMDGLASAMILKEALPGVPIVFVNYGPEHERLPAEPGLLFCDIAPPRARVQEFVDAGAIVLDHHAYARDVVAAFGERGVYGTESGAWLAYAHVHPTGRNNQVDPGIERFARLVSIRDTWRKDSDLWPSALELHAILEAFPREHWLRGDGIEAALQAFDRGIGAELVVAKIDQVARLVERGLVLSKDRVGRLWALSTAPHALVSDLAETARQVRSVDVLVNVHLRVEDGGLWFTVSLRSNERLDVGAVAHARGGGGHVRAAGFRALASEHPLTFFDDLIRVTNALQAHL